MVKDGLKLKVDSRQVARELRAEAIKTFSTLLTSAFGLVAALAWNETVKAAIERYIIPGHGLKSKLIYALLVTAIAIFVSYQLGKLAAWYKMEQEAGRDLKRK